MNTQSSDNVDLKNTLNLPQTEFPMKANLVEKEPIRQNYWNQQSLYQKIQNKRQEAPTFVLHDGPPYTNGDIHIGTAFNKILKDILVRYKNLNGYRTPFIPGWDCHGLPIEHKVSRDLEAEKKSLDAIGIRKACAAFSAKHRDKQRTQSQRLGLLADWNHEYQTMDPRFEADILRTFAHFVDGGYVYRSKKPVYWSIPCKTALAEGEVEYQNITSPAIFVKFLLKNPETLSLVTSKKIYAVIWTTTPWTLPANLAIAVHPDLEYIALEANQEIYMIAKSLQNQFENELGLSNTHILKTFSGKTLENVITEHPFIERHSPIVLADYVTADTGTGCVHTAPGHGLDDYFTGKKYNLEPYSPINDDGQYIRDGQVPENLVGISVLSHNGKNAANQHIIKILEEKQALLKLTPLEHSYPHCWRSKTPVIFRAMDQWFISLDHNDLRNKMIHVLKTVTWTPKTGENRMKGSLESRPDWCISRQRAWGTPIPIFYDENREAYMDAEVIRQLADKIAQSGTDIWFTHTAEQLLEGIILPDNWKNKVLKPGTDTLDVWIDSGSSHFAVLKNNPNLHWPADLYLEGSDQHRGWFQSSLWTAMAATGKPPYKQVLTHGFIVDEDRQKISKSSQKPQTADDYIKRFGADVIRLWVSSEDYQSDVPLSENILTQVTQTYRTIRNTLRFLIGNLYNFDYKRDKVKNKDLMPLEHWILKETQSLIIEVTKAYDAFAFHQAYQLLNKFITITLSATYHDILKDRLYVSAPDWAERRSAQTALYTILNVILKLLAPILVHTADEAYQYAHFQQDFGQNSIHLEDWPQASEIIFDEQIAQDMQLLIQLREKAHLAIEPLRQQKLIGQSSDAQLIFIGHENDSTFHLLKKYELFLPECFIVSAITLTSATETQSLEIIAKKADGVRCPRSWKWVNELVDCPGYGLMSIRSKNALLKSINTIAP